MRHRVAEEIEIPQEVSCEYNDGVLKCRKNLVELSRKIKIPEIELIIKSNKIMFMCEASNKKHYKVICSYIAHIKNLFRGLEKKYVYKLEACNVHFPMNIKVEGKEILINNFLGEKVPRKAKILQNVEVEVKGTQITVSSADIEAAGQTAANIEKASRTRNRDKRVFQDGIYITEKPGREE